MQEKSCRIGVYGSPKSGKTHFIFNYVFDESYLTLIRSNSELAPAERQVFTKPQSIGYQTISNIIYEESLDEIDAMIITVDLRNRYTISDAINEINSLKKIKNTPIIAVALTHYDLQHSKYLKEGLEDYLERNEILYQCVGSRESIEELIKKVDRAYLKNIKITEELKYEYELNKIPLETPLPPFLSNTSMMLIGGFMAVLGIAAIAVAFTVLLAPPIAALLASGGIVCLLGGLGLFSAGVARSYQDDESNDSLILKTGLTT